MSWRSRGDEEQAESRRETRKKIMTQKEGSEGSECAKVAAAVWSSLFTHFVLFISKVKVHTNKQMPRDVPALQL